MYEFVHCGNRSIQQCRTDERASKIMLTLEWEAGKF